MRKIVNISKRTSMTVIECVRSQVIQLYRHPNNISIVVAVLTRIIVG